MNTTYNLRLPEELCGKIEKAAEKNKLSINQYILYTLTKTIAYNDAMEVINEKLLLASDLGMEDILGKIPDKKPLPGDEI